MKADESKAKYDWSGVPSWVKWQFLHPGGWTIVLCSHKPFTVNEQFGYQIKCYPENTSDITPNLNLELTDWRDSLEQRPHPCATQCPNFTDEQCCHCLVGA